ncbi:MAG: threonine ammonia-lyase [Planctomycetota bacterium]
MSELTYEDILRARERFAKAAELFGEGTDEPIYRSPCPYSQGLSKLTGTRCYIKLESLQATGSFKDRGALNKLLSLDEEERRRGVIAASAGNHAQAVAYWATRLGIEATIYMPEGTPLIKRKRTATFGGKVMLYGSNLEESFAAALEERERRNLVFVHPFDDAEIIAGQGTAGLELIEQHPKLDAVIVPVGGGGLIAGMGLALKHHKPSLQLIGVEPEVVPSLTRALAAHKPVTLPPAPTIADGIRVRKVGELTEAIAERVVDKVVTVSEEDIAYAVLVLLEQEKTVTEGAAAAALAPLLTGQLEELRGKRTALVLSGGNIDVTMLARIIERGLVRDGRQMRIFVVINDSPGALAALTTKLGELGANILQIYHDRSFAQAALGETFVEMTLETRDRDHVAQIEDGLRQQGYRLTGPGGPDRPRGPRSHP